MNPSTKPHRTLRSILKSPATSDEQVQPLPRVSTVSPLTPVPSTSQKPKRSILKASSSYGDDAAPAEPNPKFQRRQAILKRPSPPPIKHPHHVVGEARSEDFVLAGLAALGGTGRTASAPGQDKRKLRRAHSYRVDNAEITGNLNKKRSNKSDHIRRTASCSPPPPISHIRRTASCASPRRSPPESMRRRSPESTNVKTEKAKPRKSISDGPQGFTLEQFLKTKLQQDQEHRARQAAVVEELVSPSPSMLSTMTVRPTIKAKLPGMPALAEADDGSEKVASKEKKSFTPEAPVSTTAQDDTPSSNVVVGPDYPPQNKKEVTGPQDSVGLDAHILNLPATKANTTLQVTKANTTLQATKKTVPATGPTTAAVVCAQLLFGAGKVEVDYVTLTTVYGTLAPMKSSSYAASHMKNGLSTVPCVRLLGPSAA